MPEISRHALVVGASRGLGLLVATEFARRGFAVTVASRDLESLERGAEQIRREVRGAEVRALECDVTDEVAVGRLVERAEADGGPIGAAIHVAGVIQVGPWQATRREHFEEAIDVMLWGPINLALALLPRMTERGAGRFGVVTSIGGRISPPRLLPYSVAKFGAVGLTEGLAGELAGTGVSATTIVPGLMRTGSHLKATFFGDAEKQYAWFGPAASLPLVAIDAEWAAKRMVAGVLAGRPVVTISPLAHVASRVHGVAPGLTVRMMQLTSRLLPTGDSPTTIEGKDAKRKLSSALVDRLTALGDKVARRTNETRA